LLALKPPVQSCSEKRNAAEMAMDYTADIPFGRTNNPTSFETLADQWREAAPSPVACLRANRSDLPLDSDSVSLLRHRGFEADVARAGGGQFPPSAGPIIAQ